MRLRISDTKQLIGGEDHSHGVEYWQVPKVILGGGSPGPRIYFANRLAGQSHIFSIDLDVDLTPLWTTLTRRLAPADTPGTFDDEGVMPADVVSTANGNKMLYSGWNSRNTVPYHNATGIADISADGDLKRTGSGPVMERNWHFPYLSVTPTVWGAGPFHCVYVNGDGWFYDADRCEPLYSLKYARSNNLLEWRRDTTTLVDWNEHRPCHSNPCHFVIDGRNIILYCDRAAVDYRANGANGYDIAGLIFDITPVSASKLEIEWEEPRLFGINDHMRAYPEVFEWDNELFLPTNGNGFGRTGILMSRIEVI